MHLISLLDLSYNLSNIIEGVHGKPQSQNIAYQWHQEEEQTNHDRLYRSYKPKKSKAISSLFSNKVITMLAMIY